MKRALFTLTLAALLLAACSPAASQLEAINYVDTGVDPESWAVVPAGEFLYGQHEHKTLVDYDYQIMVTPVTNARFADYLNEALAAGTLKLADDPELGRILVGFYPGDEYHGHKHEEEIPAGDYLHVPLEDPSLRLRFDGQTFTVRPGFENHPVVMVTWFGAKAYCDFYGWRLPTEVEWEKAARGTDNRPFPWGDHIDRTNANFYSSHDLFEKIFGGAGGMTTPVGFYNGRTYNGYETLDSASPYGLYDMAGNVWQWTGDVYEYQHYRYLRGGSFQNYAYNLRVWTNNSAGPTYYSPAVGFRCLSDQ
jgi:formylglycine-generating enzyme